MVKSWPATTERAVNGRGNHQAVVRLRNRTAGHRQFVLFLITSLSRSKSAPHVSDNLAVSPPAFGDT